MTRPAAHRLTEHRCKACGELLAEINERARFQRFALCCPQCGRHLVLRPVKQETRPIMYVPE